MIYSVVSWGDDPYCFCQKDLFYEQHKGFDKFVVAKAFADAYAKNDISIIAPYLTNPIQYSRGCYEMDVLDKDLLLTILAKEINDLNSLGEVKATIIPSCLKNKYEGADVVVKTALGKLKLFIHSFLNCAYKIEFY